MNETIAYERERKKMQWRLKMCYQAVGFFQITKYNCVGIVASTPVLQFEKNRAWKDFLKLYSLRKELQN